MILGSDFPISIAPESQHFPIVLSAHGNYYVFWQDLRFYPSDRATMAARISEQGLLVDPEGVVMIRDRTMNADVAYDGTNFLVVVQDSC